MKEKKLKKVKIKKSYVVFAATLFLLIIFLFIFFFLGSFLSPQDKLEKSDIIIVISGGDTIGRTAEGIKLLKQKYAPYILFSGAARSGEVSNAEYMKNYAMKNGVSKSKIFIEEKSTSTYENALFVKDILKEYNFKKIILVTSPYHQKRAYMNFNYVLGNDYAIINHSSIDLNWESGEWWKNKKSIDITFEEISRVIYLMVTKNYDLKNNY